MRVERRLRKHKGVRKTSSSPLSNHTKYACDDRRVANCFIWMQDRVYLGRRRARVCEFPRTREGFLAFVEEMGPIPKNMKRPSVGRIDHDKGYVKGNIRWEEHRFNSWRVRHQERTAECPKCGNYSGNSWEQCEGACPMPMSPHYRPEAERQQEEEIPF